MSETKPCPFCETTPQYDASKASTASAGIYLKHGEGCEVCSRFCRSSDWNTRPIEDKLRQELEAANNRIKELEQALYIVSYQFPPKFADIGEAALQIYNSAQKSLRIEALKQWQREAVGHLYGYKNTINDHEHIFSNVKKVMTGMIEALIKQAEEDGD